MADRHVNENSDYNHWKGRFDLSNEGKPWTSEMVDALLEGYLVRELAYYSSREHLNGVSKRSPKAVENALWKLACRYDRAIVRDYTPVARTVRTGFPFTSREAALLETALTEGVPNGAADPDHLAKVLGRSARDCEQLVVTLARQAPVLVRSKLPRETEWDREVRLAAGAVEGAWKKLWERGPR